MATRALAAVLLVVSVARAEPLAVCATTTDLGSIVRVIGGDDVSLTIFADGTDDAHFVQVTPDDLTALRAADLLVSAGLDLEAAWLPKLVAGAGNPRVRPGGAGYLDASRGVTPLGVHPGTLHPRGNPHHLLDPVRGVRVAAAIRDALGRLRPDRREAFAARHAAFAQRLGVALVGRVLSEKYDALKLAALFARGRLRPFLAFRGDADALAGWIGLLAPHRGASVVADHALWPYFARRFGVTIAAHFEPKPGAPPTDQHLVRVVRMMRERGIGVVLASASSDPSHAELVGRGTGATVLAMASHVRSRPGTSDYVTMIGFNVRQLAAALGKAGSGAAASP